MRFSQCVIKQVQPLENRKSKIENRKSLVRFTRDGSDALEERLARACHDVLEGIRQVLPASRLEAILLGGGYGRGEGGVLKTATDDAPYNDLEFYVAVRGNQFLSRRRYQRPLHKLASQLTARFG